MKVHACQEVNGPSLPHGVQLATGFGGTDLQEQAAAFESTIVHPTALEPGNSQRANQ